MNIAELIAKLMKEGVEKMTTDEIALLSDNVSLLSPAQKSAFELATKEKEVEVIEEKEVDSIDEKALKAMIANGVQENIDAKFDAISDELVGKFVTKVDEARAKAIETGVTEVKDEKREVTRDFLKALVNKDVEALKEMHEKTTTYNQAGDNARGGYTVPDELLAEVLRIKEEQYGLARREFQYLPFSGPGDERKIPTLASSVSVYWVNEAAAKTASNPTFGLVTQTLKKLVAMVPFTEELLEDSAINVTQLIATLFAEASAKEEDTQFFYGTGSPWTGILNNGSVGSVSLGTAETMADVSFEKLIDMQDECPSGALAGAKYYMHRHVLSYLRKLRTDAVSAGDSAGAFLLPLNKAGIESILGFNIELSDAFPDKTLTGASKPFVIFGNLKMAAIFGDKQQIRAKLLDQATITDGDGTTSINLAEQNMLALRLEERVGYVLAIPTAVVVLKTGAAS